MSETIQTKRCYHCNQIKSLFEFHKNRSTKDGLQSYCKICHLITERQFQKTAKGRAISYKRCKKWRQSKKGKAYQRSYSKAYNQTEKGKAVREAALKRFIARNPNYVKAKDAVKIAIRVGKLPRPDSLLCHYCPKPAQQYHHWYGYEKEHWLDVVPICTSCHAKERKKTA